MHPSKGLRNQCSEIDKFATYTAANAPTLEAQKSMNLQPTQQPVYPPKGSKVEEFAAHTAPNAPTKGARKLMNEQPT